MPSARPTYQAKIERYEKEKTEIKVGAEKMEAEATQWDKQSDEQMHFSNELVSDLGAVEDKLDLWLISGAERFSRDADLHHSLLTAAKHKDSRMCLILLGTILENPGLAERLMEVLKAPPSTPAPKPGRRS